MKQGLKIKIILPVLIVGLGVVGVLFARNHSGSFPLPHDSEYTDVVLAVGTCSVDDGHGLVIADLLGDGCGRLILAVNYSLISEEGMVDVYGSFHVVSPTDAAPVQVKFDQRVFVVHPQTGSWDDAIRNHRALIVEYP